MAITLEPREGSSSGLKDFVVPPEGAIVTVIVSSPGLVANGDMQQQDIHVPPDADSEPHRFAFPARPVGLQVIVEAYRVGPGRGFRHGRCTSLPAPASSSKQHSEIVRSTT